MDDFQGSSKLKLDAKGRVTVPSDCRKEVFPEGESRAVLTMHLYEPCLVLYPMPMWREIKAELDTLSGSSRRIGRAKRRLLNFAQSVELDVSGRIMTSALLREKANLSKEALIVGGGSCYEIWDEATYNAEDAESIEDLRENADAVAEAMGSLKL